MLLRKVSRWNFVTFSIRLVVLATTDAVESRERIYSVFKISEISLRPENFAKNFERKNYANIQIDVFIDSKAEDIRLVNLVVEDCSRKNTVVVSSSLEVGKHDIAFGDVGSKLENLILLYDSARSIDFEILKTVFENRWNPRARIIAYFEKVDNKTETEILRYFWEHDLLNVALRVQSRSSGPVENFIYNPFVPGILSGSRGRLEKLNSGESMFPDKLTDLHNHTIPISVFDYFPRALLTNFTILRQGADVEVLRALSKKLNFNVDLKTAPVDGRSYTVSDQSGEKFGMIGDVLMNRSDIILIARPMELATRYPVEFTYPMSQTGYCVLVPKARWMLMIVRMVIPFEKEIWLAIAITVGSLLICFTLMGEKNKFIKLSKLLLHHNFGRIKNRTMNRILAISCIIWAYLMDCSYQANFINQLLVQKYHKDIDTLEELYDSELPLIVAAHMVKMLNNSDKPISKKLAGRAVKQLVLNDCIRRLLTSWNVSCGTDQHNSALLARVHTKLNETLLIHPVKECLSLHWDVYVARKGFPYLEKFDHLIRALLEAGLYDKWVVDLVNSGRPVTQKPEIGKLTTQHLIGVFALFTLGLIISMVVFILELVIFKIANNVVPRMKVK